jgi:hypothetical protein
MSMKLEAWNSQAQTFTSKLSDVNRYLSFAGIGVIWIFKSDVEKIISIPTELILPLILFVVSLGFDFFQYIYSAIELTLFFRYHEKRKKIDPNKKIYKKDEIEANPILSFLPFYCFFIPKVIINIIGYILLLIYLFIHLIHS